MDQSADILWERYRSLDPAAPAALPPRFHFCDNREDADLCAALVVAGRKRATATSLAELDLAGDTLPQRGEFAIVTDWDGRAKAIIRTISVEIKRFGDIDGDFAAREGEGDLTLEWWRTTHRAYFERVLAGTAHQVDDNLEIACEDFEVVMAA
ncbi:ASCH domain-containing protein [Altericroceibacterium endophyticum]|uniref:ASCH domain-containing protein n=1 Tax=Altericroceibacterium endophyticum TaxID=1808508 RepID=A0A6I4T5S2_9SPHN|nr:ASCH domain-containing protein [Altericroceibacterium endophyticum]MXO66554.1 ASCH domain-containing protein [Altericroceibacterium endophyticum]